mgnify:FL=1
MEKDSIINLTKALYKVTSLFPEKETLINSIRKRGNLILSFLIIINNKNLILGGEELKTFSIKCKRNIKILLSYFEIAESQNWIDPKNFEILKNQYGLILKELKNIKIVEKKAVDKSEKKIVETKKETNESKFVLSEVQEKVITVLQGNGKMRPCDLNQFFLGINPRSIRRELQDLKNRGIVVSNGSGRKTFYEMNSYY